MHSCPGRRGPSVEWVFPVGGADWRGGDPGCCLPSSDFGSRGRENATGESIVTWGLFSLLPDLVEVKGAQDFGLGK